MKLFLNAFIKFVCGFLILAFLLFLPAGTFFYKGAWVFLGLLFVPIFILGAVLFVKAPELLKKRLDSKEKESTQKGVVALAAIIFLFGFVLAGLDFRFSWTKVPTAVQIIASVIFLLSYLLYAEVMRENAYLSRTIKVEADQKVIDTGLYSVVRHPMYSASILLFLQIPLILGSWISFICFLFYPLIIALRIKNEEEVLEKELSGYSEYKTKVKYKLIPFIF
jgi:protein-S-isoprenylcysteine O-methyltransferase Ste14